MRTTNEDPPIQQESRTVYELRGRFYDLVQEIGEIEVPWIVDLGYSFRAKRFLSADSGFVHSVHSKYMGDHHHGEDFNLRHHIGYLSASTALALQMSTFGPNFVADRLNHQGDGIDPQDPYKKVRFGGIEFSRFPEDKLKFELYRAVFSFLQLSAYSSVYNINPFSYRNNGCFGEWELRHVYSQTRNNSHKYFISLLEAGMGSTDLAIYFGELVASGSLNIEGIYKMLEAESKAGGRDDVNLSRVLNGLYAETIAIGKLVTLGEKVVPSNPEYDYRGVDLLACNKEGEMKYVQVKGRMRPNRGSMGRQIETGEKPTIFLNKQEIQTYLDSEGIDDLGKGLRPRDLHGIKALWNKVLDDQFRWVGSERRGFGKINSIEPVVMIVDSNYRWRAS